jgi:Flp pilus assembly protein TadG
VFYFFDFRALWRHREGSFGLLYAVLAVPLLLAVGVSIDYVIAYNERSQTQNAADGAVLAAAAGYTASTTDEDIMSTVNAYLAANASSSAELDGEPTVASDKSTLCIDAKSSVSTTFMQIANVNTIPVRVQSCATLPDLTTLEVSLVLDVSSSMIEQGRFTPMQEAVKEFIEAFSENANLASRTRIAIVPFSSRVNIGMANTGWLKSYGGNVAVPARWTSPKTYYTSSSYKFTNWIDGQTVDAYTSSNYYWMGCVEPRSDVEVKDVGAVSKYGLTDDPPGSGSTSSVVTTTSGAQVTVTPQFVAMDSNSASSKSFCPPPITPLTDDFDYLLSAITAMTSEGSTRLDAGVVAGWYTLSPSWKNTWDSDNAPADYSNSVKKIMVFMTDGMMNTQYGKSSGKLDWLCYYSQSTSTSSVCNNAAVADMLTVCKSMKTKDIEIYTVAYSDDADTTNVKSCATDDDHFYTASSSSSSDAYISTIFDAIATSIRGDTTRLTQ